MNAVVTPITIDKVDDLRELCIQTFTESFSNANTPEDLEAYIHSAFDLSRLRQELTHQNSLWFFLVSDSRKIGYLKLNLDKGHHGVQEYGALEVERIYLLASYQSKGYGQLLIDHAIGVAKERRAGKVWLGVWEYNPRAIAFYARNGFRQFDSHVFKLGSDEQRDILMERVLEY